MTTLHTISHPLPRPRQQTRVRTTAPVRRRRSRWHPPPQRARVRLPMPALARRVDAGLRIYAAAAAVLVVVLVYLVQAAQVTAASYRIEQLQSSQQSMQAEQSQLQYEEASLQAPARVQSEASRTGLVRSAPAAYVPFRSSGVDLMSPIDGTPSPDRPTFWSRILAAVGR